jgi:hypothetical protein
MFPGDDRNGERVFTLGSGLAATATYQRRMGVPIRRSN